MWRNYKVVKHQDLPALADGDDVTLLDGEGGGDVRRDILVALLVTTVLLDVLKVVTADDDGALHLGGDDETLDDAATDGHVAGEGALLVDVLSVDCVLGHLEGQANVLHVAGTLLAITGNLLSLGTIDDDLALLLEGGLGLIQSGRHFDKNLEKTRQQMRKQRKQNKIPVRFQHREATTKMGVAENWQQVNVMLLTNRTLGCVALIHVQIVQKRTPT